MVGKPAAETVARTEPNGSTDECRLSMDEANVCAVLGAAGLDERSVLLCREYVRKKSWPE